MSLEYGVLWNHRRPEVKNVDGPFGSLRGARSAARNMLAHGVTAKIAPEYALVRRDPDGEWTDFQNRSLTEAWLERWGSEDKS